MNRELQRRLDDLIYTVDRTNELLTGLDSIVSMSATKRSFNTTMNELGERIDRIDRGNERQFDYLRTIQDSLLDIYEHVNHPNTDNLVLRLEEDSDDVYTSLFEAQSMLDSYDDLHK